MGLLHRSSNTTATIDTYYITTYIIVDIRLPNEYNTAVFKHRVDHGRNWGRCSYICAAYKLTLSVGITQET